MLRATTSALWAVRVEANAAIGAGPQHRRPIDRDVSPNVDVLADGSQGAPGLDAAASGDSRGDVQRTAALDVAGSVGGFDGVHRLRHTTNSAPMLTTTRKATRRS
jgi:hypothetical protein